MDIVNDQEMPKYKCHKEVWALKITEIKKDVDLAKKEDRETDGSIIIVPEEAGYSPFKLSHEYALKHKPVVGGYYVQYKDGYHSFSSAEAFEQGYSKL